MASRRDSLTCSDLDDETDIIPIELYNAEQGKLLASLSWLITKVYGKNVPDSLVNPCYKDEKNQIHLKPGTMYSLTSGELYCAAASTIFHDVGYLNQSHGVVLQALQRYSIHVTDIDENVVTETVLNQTAPFKMNAHLAMIDALMTAYTREIISVQRVVQCLKKYVNVHANELPCDVEDALLFWINKISSAVRDTLEKHQSAKNADLPLIPEMEDMYEDICDGACVATLISFYAPEHLNLKEICFNDPMSFADCLHNLRLIKAFCSKYFPWNPFHFAFEDVLYMHESLQTNVNAFVTDLFYFFESTQDVKSPPIGASLTKRFFNRVGIPDLRGGEKDTTKAMDHRSALNRPTKLSHAPAATSSTKDPLAAMSSIGTSRMNSTDSLMTERSYDSLRYPTYKTNNAQMEISPLTPSTTFADSVHDSSSSKQSPADYGGGIVGASDYSPNGNNNPMFNGLSAQNSLKGPSFAVRMQLEAKRRQIEAQQMLEKNERAKVGQQINKDAFMKLYGKPSSMSGSTGSIGGQHQNGEHTVGGGLNNGSSNPSVPYDEISKSILEIKEQMKMLAVEQERLQQNIVNAAQQPSPNLMTQSMDHLQLSAMYGQQNLQTINSPQQHQSNVSLTAGPFLANGHALIRHSHEAEPFRLHAENETPSRLDPSLELTTNLSSWGMTNRGGNKTPRRTWGENQNDQTYTVLPAPFPSAAEFQQHFQNQQQQSYAKQQPELFQQQQQQYFQNQQAAFMHHLQQQQQNVPPPLPVLTMPSVAEEPFQPTSPSYLEMVPAEPHFEQPPPTVTMYNQVQYAPAPSAGYVVVTTVSQMPTTVMTSPTVAVNSTSWPTAALSSPIPPTTAESLATPFGYGNQESSKYYTPPSSAYENNNDNDGRSPFSSSTTVGRDDRQQLSFENFANDASSSVHLARSVSPSSGIGYVVVVDDEDKAMQDDELNRKKELIVAAAMRRKAQLERRKEVGEEINQKRTEEWARKDEMVKQRKREQEQRRNKAFEEYQRKKAEQEALDQSGRIMSKSQTSGTLPKPSKIQRPTSSHVAAKSIPNVRTTSVDNLEQIDGKSQSSEGAGSNSQISESSVKLFVKPSQKTNRNIIYNAIQYCVLAGPVNDEKKRKCLEEFAKSDCKHFLVLFRDQKCQFRGLYGWDQCSDTIHKLYGMGPGSCSEIMVDLLFKYDSGAKQFGQIPSKHFSATIDGFTIDDKYWQAKKPLYAKSKTMKS